MRRSLLAGLIVVLVAGCEAAAPTLAPTPGASIPAPSASASQPPASQPDVTATPPSPGPTDEATLILGGSWVRPSGGATLTAYQTTLAARPSASGPGVTTFSKVAFRVTPAGGDEIAACTARRPNDDGVWSCKADLVALGVAPGVVRFSFDVFGVGVEPARSPAGNRKVTYAVPPPKPADAAWKDLGSRKTGRWEYTRTYRVRWSAPEGYATEFLVYNTWACPRDSARNVGEPCYVAGTPVDVSQLELLGRAPGDARQMKFDLVEYECGPSYGTVLLRARNAYGQSAFAIVEVATVPDPRDMVC
jgi:hypothetical protein